MTLLIEWALNMIFENSYNLEQDNQKKYFENPP